MICACFAGTGKTSLATNSPVDFIDLESSDYQWTFNKDMDREERKGTEEKEKNPDFPLNYIQDIREMDKYRNVLIACQPSVLKALAQANVNYTVVTPEAYLKEEYLDRYRERGNTQGFIDLMDRNFNDFVNDLKTNIHASACITIKQKGIFLTNIFR